MKILLLGANGQVGWHLRNSLAKVGVLKACTKSEANLENPKQLKKTIQNYKPNIIVNAAAYTSVDKAEIESKKANIINAIALEILSSEAKNLNAVLVHYSTDYIFDGKKIEGYKENDKPNPLSVYGKTKLDGENNIIGSGCKYLIFRTSWVHSSRGSNFIKKIIKLAKEKEYLNIVSDQTGSPTGANYIANVTAYCLQNLEDSKYGIYNLTSSGKTNWHELAIFTINQLARYGINVKPKIENIKPILTEDYPLPAKRPKNSKLCTNKIQKTFNLDIPHWEDDVKLTLESLYSK